MADHSRVALVLATTVESPATINRITCHVAHGTCLSWGLATEDEICVGYTYVTLEVSVA